jgi:hypothetical protein
MALLFFFIPNLLLGCSFIYVLQTRSSITDPLGCLRNFIFFLDTMSLESLILWIIANASLGCLLLLMRRHIFYPLMGMTHHIQHLLDVMHPGAMLPVSRTFNIRHTLYNIAHIAHVAQDHIARQRDTKAALLEAQATLKQIVAHHTIILQSTSREMATQYQAVLSYANYLEEHIAQHSPSQDLRYDFDEVSESAFNLKLIAGALELIQHPQHIHYAPIHIPELIQNTMLSLAANLDRRCMKLTTLEVDEGVMAYSNPAIITHTLWMLLLGIIRYAADESTLRLRCLYSRDQSTALISITVSELSPGRLTAEERGTFLARQLCHFSPHMFAETIRIHANLQLAEILISPLQAQLGIIPLTGHSCEICLKLPTPTA